MQYTLNTIARKLSDWKVVITAVVVVLTTLFNFGSSLFNYALISKLAPINTKVSAIEEAGKQRDIELDKHKSDNDRDYSNLVNKIDNLTNKFDKLTFKLIGYSFK